MGDRAHEEPTAEEIAEMAVLVEQALEAGAAGFTTSRTILHSSRTASCRAPPRRTTSCSPSADAIGRAGHGVFQLVSDQLRSPATRSGSSSPRSPAAPAPPSPTRSPRRRRARTRGAAALDDAAELTRRGCGSCRRSPAGPPGCCSGCSPRCTRSSPTRRSGAGRPAARRAGGGAAQARGAGRSCWPRTRPPRNRVAAAS